MYSNFGRPFAPAGSPIVAGSDPTIIRIANPSNAAQTVDVNVDELFLSMVTNFADGPYAACIAWPKMPLELQKQYVFNQVRAKYPSATWLTEDLMPSIVRQFTGFCSVGITTGAIRSDSRVVPAPMSSTPLSTASMAPKGMMSWLSIGIISAMVIGAYYAGKKGY